jgi:outer membrane protein OmpA-like peptidoglycan-associated protein
MKHVLTIMMLAAMATATLAQQSVIQTERRSDAYTHPQAFGLGLSLGMSQLNGDVQNNSLMFPDAETPWQFGATLDADISLLRMEEFAKLSLLAGVGFHPYKAKSPSIENEQTALEVSANLLAFTAGIQVEFFPTGVLRPFFFGRIGFATYSQDLIMSSAAQAKYAGNLSADDKSCLAFPIGGGLALALSDNMDLFVGFQKIYTMSDNLDRWTSEINDNIPYIFAGVKLFFGGVEEKKEEKIIIPPAPVVLDTDGDGLLDTDERTIYKTDPTKKDTDGDGLIDGDEVKTYKTDPLNKDTDGDRLIDGDEVLRYKTDPLKKDTDGDGCDDGREVLEMRTDPLKKDTDGDALTDCDEVNIYKTNPLMADTDGDGVNDGLEVKNNTNPLKADVLKIEDNKPIVLEGITFETNKTTILPASEEILNKALNTMRAYPTLKVEISGHTDDVGKDAANQKLSEGRANSVRNWLIAKSVDGARIVPVGYGEKQPMVPNTSPENRQQNRRIEFKILSR